MCCLGIPSPLFLAPPVGVQVISSVTKRVYHIQLIKTTITLHTFIIYRCVRCIILEGLELGTIARYRSHRSDSCWVDRSFACILLPEQYRCVWLVTTSTHTGALAPLPEPGTQEAHAYTDGGIRWLPRPRRLRGRADVEGQDRGDKWRRAGHHQP